MTSSIHVAVENSEKHLLMKERRHEGSHAAFAPSVKLKNWSSVLRERRVVGVSEYRTVSALDINGDTLTAVVTRTMELPRL